MAMEQLTIDEVARSARIGVDASGTVFERDGRFYRAFRHDAATVIQRLLASPQLEALFELGLVRFERADMQVDGFEVVVAVERVPIESYATEWPTCMVKEAALLTLRL
ncbi:MAG: hypothetical protein ACI9WU_003906, partial [Myxococcota bacterium]